MNYLLHYRLLTVFVLCFPQLFYGQSDSLWNVWSNEKNHDTVRLEALDEFIHLDDFPRNYPDSAIEYAQLFLDHAERVEHLLYLAKAHTLNGMINHQKGSVLQAREHFNSALKIQENMGDTAGAANSLNRIGVTFRSTGQYHEAIEKYSLSMKLQLAIGDSVGVARSLQNIGNVHMSRGDYEEAYKFMSRSMKILTTLNEAPMIAAAWNNLGIMYMEQGRLDSAIYSFTKGVEIRSEIGDELGSAGPLYNIGIIHYNQGNYSVAVKSFKKGLLLFEKYGELRSSAQVLNTMAQVLRDMGDYVGAINHNHKALKIREETDDPFGVAQTLVNIGLLYMDQKEYEKALDFCTQGLDFFEKIETKREISEALNSIGTIQFKRNLFSEAEDYHTRSLKISREIGNRQGESVSLNNLGLIYLETNKLPLAIESFEQSIQISEEIGNLQRIAHPMNSLAEAYLVQNDFVKARNWSQKALENATEYGTISGVREAAHNLYKTNKQLGDIAKALEMHELYIQMRDSIASEENIKELARFEFKYEYKKKALADSLRTLADNETLALNHKVEVAQKETERNLYASAGLILLFASFVFYQRKVNKNKLVLKEKEAAYQQELIYASITSQENERRRIARDLHDEVGAMLSTLKLQLGVVGKKLSATGASEDPTKPALSLVDETITNVRRISKDLLPPTLEEFGLAHALEDLADKVASASGILIKREIQPLSKRLEVERELALYRVIQEMMNNALKHAEATEFNLKMTENDGRLHLSFSDNGKGFDVDAVKNSKAGKTGLGLKNLENRVGAAGGEMSFGSQPGRGTWIELNVPLEIMSDAA